MATGLPRFWAEFFAAALYVFTLEFLHAFFTIVAKAALHHVSLMSGYLTSRWYYSAAGYLALSGAQVALFLALWPSTASTSMRWLLISSAIASVFPWQVILQQWRRRVFELNYRDPRGVRQWLSLTSIVTVPLLLTHLASQFAVTPLRVILCGCLLSGAAMVVWRGVRGPYRHQCIRYRELDLLRVGVTSERSVGEPVLWKIRYLGENRRFALGLALFLVAHGKLILKSSYLRLTGRDAEAYRRTFWNDYHRGLAGVFFILRLYRLTEWAAARTTSLYAQDLAVRAMAFSGDLARAKRTLQKLIRQHRDHSYFHLTNSLLLWDAHRVDKALKAVDSAIETYRLLPGSDRTNKVCPYSYSWKAFLLVEQALEKSNDPANILQAVVAGQKLVDLSKSVIARGASASDRGKRAVRWSSTYPYLEAPSAIRMVEGYLGYVRGGLMDRNELRSAAWQSAAEAFLECIAYGDHVLSRYYLACLLMHNSQEFNKASYQFARVRHSLRNRNSRLAQMTDERLNLIRCLRAMNAALKRERMYEQVTINENWVTCVTQTASGKACDTPNIVSAVVDEVGLRTDRVREFQPQQIVVKLQSDRLKPGIVGTWESGRPTLLCSGEMAQCFVERSGPRKSIIDIREGGVGLSQIVGDLGPPPMEPAGTR